jgi:hypothetical protein
MKLPPSSKRVSIQYDATTEVDYQLIIDQLSECAGVLEATLVEDESRIYLKVNKKGYDQPAVSSLVEKIK